MTKFMYKSPSFAVAFAVLALACPGVVPCWAQSPNIEMLKKERADALKAVEKAEDNVIYWKGEQRPGALVPVGALRGAEDALRQERARLELAEVRLQRAARETAQAATPVGDTARLRQALADPDANVRRKAAEDLGRMGSAAQDAIPDLIKALKDPDANVRQAAVEALKRTQAAAPPARTDGPMRNLAAVQRHGEVVERIAECEADILRFQNEARENQRMSREFYAGGNMTLGGVCAGLAQGASRNIADRQREIAGLKAELARLEK